MVNWRAVLVGFAVEFVLGVFAIGLPGVGHAAAGLAGGFVAGWMAGGGLGRGAWHGMLAGALGGIIVALFIVLIGIGVGLTGFEPAGFLGLGLGLVALVVFLLLAVDSAIAGAVGGWLAS